MWHNFICWTYDFRFFSFALLMRQPSPRCGRGLFSRRREVGGFAPFYVWAGILHKNLCETLFNLPIAFIPKM